MKSEYLAHRRLKIPESSPEPLVQLLSRAQQELEGPSGLDALCGVHDCLAFLTEFFAAFATGALKTVGPYSRALEDLQKTAPSLDRSERMLNQAFQDWKAHPHHPAHESLRDAFFLTSRLQSSRTAPRRHTRWLGLEGRSVEGLERLSRWSRHVDLLMESKNDSEARDQIQAYLPLLWIWTDALGDFFREWSLRLKTDVQAGKLSISGTANRDDIHLHLVPSPPLGALKSIFEIDLSGSLTLAGFAVGLNGRTGSAGTETTSAAVSPGTTTLGVVEPDIPSPSPVPSGDVSAESDFELVFDESSGTYVIHSGSKPEGDVATPPDSVSVPPAQESTVADTPAILGLTASLLNLNPPDASVPSPAELPDLKSTQPAVPIFESPGAALEPEVPVLEPPAPEPELEPVSEPVAAVEPEAPVFELPVFEPPALEPEPVPEPVAAVEPEPPALEPEPVPEPVAAVEPESPVFEPPALEPEHVPEPLAAVEPEPPVFEPPALEPEPVPEPVAAVEPESPVLEPPALEPEPVPEPVAAVEPKPPVFEPPVFEPPAFEPPVFDPPVFEPPALVPEPVAAVEPEPHIFEPPSLEPEAPGEPEVEHTALGVPEPTAGEPDIFHMDFSGSDLDFDEVDSEVPLFKEPELENVEFLSEPATFEPTVEMGVGPIHELTVELEPSDIPIEARTPLSLTESDLPDLISPEVAPPGVPGAGDSSLLPSVVVPMVLGVIPDASDPLPSPEPVPQSDSFELPAVSVPVAPAVEEKPEVVEAHIEPPAVTLTQPEAAIVEMGAQAEEILDDQFEFSPEAGPVRPQWSGWGVSEREAIQELCESLLSEQSIPQAFSEPVLRALGSGQNKFQIVLGPGCGKSRLAEQLQALEPQGGFGPSLRVEWPSSYSAPTDGSELASFYFQLKDEAKAHVESIILPEPEAVASLIAVIPRDGFSQVFQRFLGQVAVLNPRGLTLLLDEAPEDLRQSLNFELPARLRVVSFVSPMNSGDELGHKLDLQSAWPVAAVQIFGSTVNEVVSDPAASLLRVGLYVQLKSAGLALPSSLADIVDAALGSSIMDIDLAACLALEDRFISLDDLDQWFLQANRVADCIKAFPALFKVRKTRLSPLLGLSHNSIVSTVVSSHSDSYNRAAKSLLGWVVALLERTNPEKYGGLQVREIVFRNFCRLYRYAQLTDSLEVLEWVVRNKDLQRHRVELTIHLETPSHRWDLQRLLTSLADSLSMLVASGQCDDLRDEQAWAFANRAFNCLNLGLVATAEDEIQKAQDLFQTLIDKEKQHEFRPALATTLYRASRIALASEDRVGALDFADRAVGQFVELVEDRGRVELQSRLGVALAHRGTLKSFAGETAGALKDLQRAASLLASADPGKQKENKRFQIEVQLELASIHLKAQDTESAVKDSGKAVQLATEAVEELQLEELQPLLASCHTARAQGYLQLNEIERAQRDVSKSITLRNLAVDEGRLDQRSELAKEYLLRSKIGRARGLRDDSARDLDRSLEILGQLVTEGRSDVKGQFIGCLVERAELSVEKGDAARSIEDLQKALDFSRGQTTETAEGQTQRVSILEGLLKAYSASGVTESSLAISTELLTLYQARQEWEQYARVQVTRAEILSRQGDVAAAGEGFTQAIGLVSKLLEQGQTPERLSLVADAYLGSGRVEIKLKNSERATEQTRRALDIYNHLFQQLGVQTALPKMLQAYGLFTTVSLEKGNPGEALASLKSAFDVLAYIEGKGASSVSVPEMERLKARFFRQRAEVFYLQGDGQAALQDSDESMRNFLLDRQKNQTGPWKDELARTWRLRSSIFFLLKDFTQAESSIQEAITHFEEQVRLGRIEFFDDLIKSLSTRAENAAKAGKIDRVLEEYGRMLHFANAAGEAGSGINVEWESAKILENRARVYRDQSLFNEAYADYDRVIGLYRKLLTEKGRTDLATELVRIHLERGEMILSAGHTEHAIGDFTEVISLAKALVAQGQFLAAPALAQGLQRRSECYKATGKAREALQDLEGAVGFQMQMAQQKPDIEVMGNLAKALLSQGGLLIGFQQLPQAADSLDKAISLLTGLVEQQQQKQYSGDLAQALIQRVSLTGDKTDPGMRQVLIRAVDLVTQQAREGKPVARDFPIDCLRAVVDLLAREDFETVGDLIDSVLRLVELVVTDGKSSQDFVKLTDLLLAASAGLIDDRRTARRPHFLALACVSCNREIQMFGKNSLPRLVYCLYELGQALERSKPPSVLNYIGSSFALMGELASQQQNNEDFIRELKMMVTTWRSLPPQVPALANVSRHMLSQLLRLT